MLEKSATGMGKRSPDDGVTGVLFDLHVETQAAVRGALESVLTREQWLVDAAGRMSPWLSENGYPMPKSVRYSCGFPVGGVRKVIGQCWSATASKDGHFEIFISPVLDDAYAVSETLLHEMIHAACPGCGHRGRFRKAALALGFLPPMRTTPASPELKDRLNALIATLPPYGHGAINADKGGRKKQTTRMKKCVCATCGYTIRVATRWIELGLPTCVCGSEFEEAD